MSRPRLADVMSTFPERVDASRTVDEALALLAEHSFHHLPVEDGDRTIGVFSDRQLRLAAQLGSGDRQLRDLCEPPVLVDIQTPISQVAYALRSSEHGNLEVCEREDGGPDVEAVDEIALR